MERMTLRYNISKNIVTPKTLTRHWASIRMQRSRLKIKRILENMQLQNTYDEFKPTGLQQLHCLLYLLYQGIFLTSSGAHQKHAYTVCLRILGYIHLHFHYVPIMSIHKNPGVR